MRRSTTSAPVDATRCARAATYVRRSVVTACEQWRRLGHWRRLTRQWREDVDRFLGQARGPDGHPKAASARRPRGRDRSVRTHERHRADHRGSASSRWSGSPELISHFPGRVVPCSIRKPPLRRVDIGKDSQSPGRRHPRRARRVSDGARDRPRKSALGETFGSLPSLAVPSRREWATRDERLG